MHPGTQIITSSGRQTELDLILAAACPPRGSYSGERIRRLAEEGLDWSYVHRTASEHGILPVVYHNLRDCRGLRIHRADLASMRETFHRWGLLVHLRVSELQRLIEWASNRGIEVLPFKGPALGAYAYGDATLRKPGDLDLLVRRDDFASMRRLLVSAGYEPRISASEEEDYLEKRQGYAFDGATCSVDLHWTLEQPVFDNFPLSFRVSPEELWATARADSLGGTPVTRLSDEYLLLYLCAHGAKHSWSRLYLICDVAALVEQGEIDWERLMHVARELRMKRVLALGLLLARELLDMQMPAEMKQTIADEAVVRKIASSFADRLFEPQSKEGKLQHTLTRLRLLDSLDDRLRYVLSRGLRTLFSN